MSVLNKIKSLFSAKPKKVVKKRAAPIVTIRNTGRQPAMTPIQGKAVSSIYRKGVSLNLLSEAVGVSRHVLVHNINKHNEANKE